MTKIMNVGQALLSMRNAPYTTESALAELMDNSIQAKADYIGVLIKDGHIESGTKVLKRIEQIGIFDNGHGMDEELLQNCLAVGFSRNKLDLEGLGKFGYGMLIGSLSQSFRIEVYSWQENKPIFHTYVDIRELLANNSEDIPPIIEVKSLPLIDKLKSDAHLNSNKSGTLVVLKDIDYTRVGVKTGSGLYDHMKAKLGRIYRHFLDDDNDYGTKRDMEIITMGTNGNILIRNKLLPNDPQFLLTPNMLPVLDGVDYSKESTSMSLDETIKIPVEYEVFDELDAPTGEIRQSIVDINSTFIKPQLRKLLDANYSSAGASPIGDLYEDNIGISMMRAAREIKIDGFGGFVNNSDPTERWWGVEIRFKPELDKIFGVSADKQSILNIHYIKQGTPKSYFENEDEDLAIKFNIQLNKIVKKQIAALRSLVQKSKSSRKPGKGGDDTVTIETAAGGIIEKDGTSTKSGIIQAEKTPEQRLAELKTLYEGANPDLSPEEIDDMAKKAMDMVIEFVKDEWAGTTFLDNQPIAKGAAAKINTRTKFYKLFFSVLEEMEDSTGENALKLLLMAFIRTEDELSQKYDPDSVIFDEFRNRWGHWVDELLPLVEK